MGIEEDGGRRRIAAHRSVASEGEPPSGGPTTGGSGWTWRVRSHPHVFALIFFLALILASFWPLLENFAGLTLFNPLGIGKNMDQWHFMWDFWWFRTALERGLNPYFTTYIFYPQGASLALQTLDFMDAAISLPVAVTLGEVAAFNFVVLLGMCLSGFFAYLLAWHISKSWSGSIAAGVIFALFPEHVSELFAGHPNLTSIEWVPAYFLLLMLTYETGRFRHASLAGVVLACATYTELELTFMLGMATLLYVLYLVVTERMGAVTRRNTMLLVTLVGVWAVAASPYLYYAAGALLSGTRAVPLLATTVANALKPGLFVTPSPFSLFTGKIVLSLYSKVYLTGGSSEWTVFVGWTALALGALGMIYSRDRRRYLLVTMVLGAFYFALGPSLNSGAWWQSPLTLLYQNVRLIQFFRTPARMSIILMLGLSCLAAFGVKWLVSVSEGRGLGGRGRGLPFGGKRVAPQWRGRIVAAVCIGLILFEFFPTVQTSPVITYPAYGATSSSETPFSMLVIPAFGSTTQFYLYEQTLNGIPFVNGKLSQLNQTLPSYMYSELFLRLLSRPRLSPVPDILSQNLSETQLAPVVMSYFGIKYILVQDNELNVGVNYTTVDPLALTLVTRELTATLGAPIYSDNNTQLYGLQALLTTGQIESMATRVGPIVLFGTGWSPPGSGGRVAAHLSTLLVYVSAAAEYSVQMVYSGPLVCIWNQNITLAASCGFFNPSDRVTTYGVELLPGLNTVDLSTEGGGDFTVTSLSVSR